MAISTDLDFREKIKEFTPEGKFLAEQIYDIQRNCPACNISTPSNKKVIGISGISGIIGGAIVFIIEYFTVRSKSG